VARIHVGAFKIGGIVCSPSHAPRSGVEAMEITRAEGTGRFLKRFDFIAREISGFGSETSLRKNGEKGKRGQSPVSHMTFPVSRYILCPLASDSRSTALSRPPCRALFFYISESMVKVVCTRAGWQIGRGISFYRMRGLPRPESWERFPEECNIPVS